MCPRRGERNSDWPARAQQVDSTATSLPPCSMRASAREQQQRSFPDRQFRRQQPIDKMRTLSVLACLLLLLAAIEAKKSHSNSPDESPVEAETKTHSAKKYTKEHQKSHHHTHKAGKQAPVEVPESEVKLQEDLSSDKAVDPVKDLHLQDLAYEEELQKKKSKGGHHGTHKVEVEPEGKLFEAEPKKEAVDEKGIEDAFEPLDKKQEKKNKEGEKNKDKKNKSNKGNKNKKAYEKKNKGSEKKHKEGNKKHKNKGHKKQ